MKDVVKRNSEKERWDDGKVRSSIEAAAREAGYADEKVKNVVSQVVPSVAEMTKGRKVVRTTEIRERILKALDERYPEASAAWRSFDTVKESR
jgi:transcriptional regulator NrdR family protein